MNYHVVLSGWRAGIRKVSLAEPLGDRGDFGLHEPHNVVARLLSGERVAIPMADAAAAAALAHDAEALGAVAAVVVAA